MTDQPAPLPPSEVRRMFDRISPVYDAMNRVMTAGLDRRWRRLTVEAVVQPGDRVLDACCGTGDLALAAQSRRAASSRGSTSPSAMLERARRKSGAVDVGARATCIALPFEDASFDAATVGFGIRNVAELEAGLAELRARARSRRPPRLPRDHAAARRARARSSASGSTASSRCSARCSRAAQAYTYLPASVRRFPGPDELAAAMDRAGFEEIRWRLLAGGIVALHTARRRA